VRLVFEPKSSRIDQTEFINTLLAHTSMESNAAINLVMIGGDGRPRQKALPEILGEWVAFRQATMTRRTRHRLGKVNDRIHILEGRLIVFLNIDEVIQTIRESDEPKPALIDRFKLTDRQADDILEIRLRQLARLERLKIERELSELSDEKKKLEELLGSDSAMRRLMIREIEADAKQYGDDRRTLIQQEKRASAEARVVDEPVTVIVSARGWVRTQKGHGLDSAMFTFKAGDSLYGAFECRTTDNLIAWGNNGRVYSTAVAGLPGGRGDGVPVTSLVDLESGTRLLHYYAAAPERLLLLATSAGYGFLSKLGDLVSRNRSGKSFMTIEGEGDTQPVPLMPTPVLDGATEVACLASDGRLLVFGIDEMKTMAGGRGVTLMSLEDGQSLLQSVAFTPVGLVLQGERGGKPVEAVLNNDALDPHRGKRAKRGKVPANRLKPTGLRPAIR
ncbi:DNA gyrase subunit A, partial [Robbsia andropogonis]